MDKNQYIKNDKESLFPNTTTLASYDPISQVILLNTIERKHLIEMHKNPEDYKTRENIKILMHECTHYLDHISTLWGQMSLIKIYNALNAIILQNEYEFWRVISFYNDLHKYKFSKYYSIKNPKFKANTKERWKYRLTAGLRFDMYGRSNVNAPILFTRFMTTDGNLVCRVPFSIESLLETNAMASEFKVDRAYINSLDPDKKTVEVKLLENKSLSWLYNPELAIYSTAAHFVGNCMDFKDIELGFDISSRIGSICLNMPDDFYKNLLIPSSFNAFKERNEKFIEQKDIGFLYASIFQNIQDKRYILNPEKIDLSKILLLSNLPEIKDIEKCLIEKFDSIRTEIFNGPLTPSLLFLLDKGKEIFTKRGILGDKYDYSDLLIDGDFPPVIFSDDLDNTVTCKKYEYIGILESKMIEFRQACGY